MKKTVSLCILTGLLLAVLSACGAKTEEIVPEYSTDIGGVMDLNGKEYIIRDTVHHGDTPLIPTSMENALDDMLLEHYEQTEKALNCELSLLVNNGDIAQNVASGLKYADLINCQFGPIFSYFKAGIAANYNDIPGIDIHCGKFGSENLLDALTWGNGTYGVVAEYWGIPTPYFNDACMFNPRILRTYSQPSPHELWENNNWNFDTFTDIAVAVTDLTSNPDFPIYATGLNSYFIRAAFFASGATVAKENEDGTLSYNLPSKEADTAAEWLKKLNNELKVLDPNTSGSWEYYCDMFTGGQYAFLAEYSWVGLSKDNGRVGLNMEEEFSWVPFPRGPLGNKDVLATYADANFAMFVPINGETDEIGYVMTELFEPLYEGNNYGWREDFEREVFWDETSYNLYIRILDSAVSDNMLYASSSNLVNNLSAVVKGTKSVQQAFSEIADKVQAQLDSEYNDFINK